MRTRKTITLRTARYKNSPIPLELFRFKLYNTAYFKLRELCENDLTGEYEDAWQIVDIKETDNKNRKGEFTTISLKVVFEHYEN